MNTASGNSYHTAMNSADAGKEMVGSVKRCDVRGWMHPLQLFLPFQIYIILHQLKSLLDHKKALDMVYTPRRQG